MGISPREFSTLAASIPGLNARRLLSSHQPSVRILDNSRTLNRALESAGSSVRGCPTRSNLVTSFRKGTLCQIGSELLQSGITHDKKQVENVTPTILPMARSFCSRLLYVRMMSTSLDDTVASRLLLDNRSTIELGIAVLAPQNLFFQEMVLSLRMQVGFQRILVFFS